MTDPRLIARKLANDAMLAGRPLNWFEQLYSMASTEDVSIPWADREPNPNLIELFEKLSRVPFGKHAIKVGCGLGDDAEWLSRKGFDTTAFDISHTAIQECHRRFTNSRVHYIEIDLFNYPAKWKEAFDLVLESYTLQVLPQELRVEALTKIYELVAPGGYLLLITRARDESDPKGSMPWPLTKSEVDQFISLGLANIYFEDYSDRENPPVRRFRACYHRKDA